MKELEMILQAVAQLGDAGKDAFIWWLVMDKGLGFLGWILSLGVVSFTLLKVVRYTNQDDLRVLRDAMGVGTPGVVSDEELREMHRWIRSRKGG